MNRGLQICIFLLLPFFTLAQPYFSLQVVDEEGQPMPGVTVHDKNFIFTSVTDGEGFLQMSNIEDDHILIFEFLGYQKVVLAFGKLPQDPNILIMKPSMELLDEVIVVGRTDDIASNLGYQVEFIHRDKMKLLQSQNSADALADNSMVFVQKSQMGGGSPIIRGFEANQVLLVVDGIRLNNAIYRSGHLQNAITVDHSVLDRMEVIYGPGSLIYGSDALGGVVHFRTLQPAFLSQDDQSPVTISGEYGLKYNTANKEKSLNLGLAAVAVNWTSFTGISASSFSDLRAGSLRNHDYKEFGKRSHYVDTDSDQVLVNPNEEIQIGTAYDQLNYIQKFKVKISDHFQLGANFQYSTSSDIPRYDQLSAVDDEGTFDYSEWYYGPQKRLLLAVRADFRSYSGLFDSGSFIAAHQALGEDRISRNFGSPFRNHNLEDVNVWNFNLDLKKSVGSSEQMFLQYGFEFFTNDVTSEAFSENRNSGIKSYDILSRYPSGGSQWNGGGLYAMWSGGFLNERLKLEAGLRYSFFQADVLYNQSDVFTWPAYFYDGISQNNDALTFAGGLRLNLPANWRLKLYGGTAFRSPNIDDFAKVRVKSANISVPNPQLNPVKTTSLEVSIGKTISVEKPWLKSIETGLTGYQTWINDAIVRRDFAMPNGDTLYNFQGNTYRVQSNVNAQEGFIRGLSASIRAQITGNLNAEFSYNIQKGISQDQSTETPLAHIPPAYGKAGLSFVESRIELSIFMRFNGEKQIKDYAPLGSSDNLEFATPEGTPSWTTWNTYASYQINKAISLKFSVENISDLHYRPFSSGVSASGRNFKFGIVGNF